MTQAQESVPTSLFPLWDRSLSVRTGVGYKDNVLLSHVKPQESLFFTVGLEASAFRLSEDGTELNLLLTADDNHYFSVKQLSDEVIFLTQFQFKKPLRAVWQTTFAVEYFYQDQVMDVSATELNLRTVHVQAHNFQTTPAMRRELGESGWLELSLPIARRVFRQPLDSFWEGGPRLAFGHPYGQKSEWTLAYSFNARAYDTRTQVDATTAQSIPGTELRFLQHKFELGSWHYWDAPRRWRTATKLAYKLNDDNGTGYFDYGKIQFSEQLRFRARRWELLAEVRLGDSLFDAQTVSPEDLTQRRLSEFIWHLRVETQLVKWLKAYADFEQERNFSNQPIERYTVNTISGGFILEF